MWDTLPSEIIMLRSMSVFKEKVKKKIARKIILSLYTCICICLMRVSFQNDRKLVV